MSFYAVCATGTDIDHFLFCIVDLCTNSTVEAIIYVSLLGTELGILSTLTFNFIDRLLG